MDLALKAGRVVGHLEVAVHLLILFGRPIFRPDVVRLIWLSSADGRRE